MSEDDPTNARGVRHHGEFVLAQWWALKTAMNPEIPDEADECQHIYEPLKGFIEMPPAGSTSIKAEFDVRIVPKLEQSPNIKKEVCTGDSQRRVRKATGQGRIVGDFAYIEYGLELENERIPGFCVVSVAGREDVEDFEATGYWMTRNYHGIVGDQEAPDRGRVAFGPIAFRVVRDSAFLSHSSADDDFARRLHADLEDHGVRCWFAPHDMRIGDRVQERINEAIRLHKKLILILSERSVHSDWVEHEVERALEQEAERAQPVLFPIRLDDSVFDVKLGWARQIVDATKPTGRHVGDFTGWKDHDRYRGAFERLLRDLKQVAGG